MYLRDPSLGFLISKVCLELSFNIHIINKYLSRSIIANTTSASTDNWSSRLSRSYTSTLYDPAIKASQRILLTIHTIFHPRRCAGRNGLHTSSVVRNIRNIGHKISNAATRLLTMDIAKVTKIGPQSHPRK